MGELTTNEAAERLGVSLSTLKTWLFKLQIPTHQDSRGRRKFDDKALGLLEIVKSLRDDDCGYQTIRRRIGPQVSGSSPLDELDIARDERQLTHGSPADMDQLAEVIRTELAAVQSLSEKIAWASHRIGELETTVKFKDEKIAELHAKFEEQSKKIELLEAPKRPWWQFWR